MISTMVKDGYHSKAQEHLESSLLFGSSDSWELKCSSSGSCFTLERHWLNKQF